jgi:hypothetical protein
MLSSNVEKGIVGAKKYLGCLGIHSGVERLGHRDDFVSSDTKNKKYLRLVFSL